jgi:uncharacterized protein
MPDPHRAFFAQLPFLVAGTLDGTAAPQAMLLAGAPGFAYSPDPTRLRVDAQPRGLALGAPVGLLGIEAQTRRRNRLNGIVNVVDDAGFEITVQQSFGNCPKYIQPREAEYDVSRLTAGATRELNALDDDALQLVRASDTFFIATAHPDAGRGTDRTHGVDVSHRGGPAGFVQADAHVLRVPDFLGNFYFNTLGNLLLQPRCGLLFVDYATASVLQVAARGEIVRDDNGRQLLLHVDSARYTANALPLRWR